MKNNLVSGDVITTISSHGVKEGDTIIYSSNSETETIKVGKVLSTTAINIRTLKWYEWAWHWIKNIRARLQRWRWRRKVKTLYD